MLLSNLKLDFIRDQILLDLGRSLVSLDKLLVVSSHDLQSHHLDIIFTITSQSK